MPEEEREALEARLGYHFREPDWLERALTHSSRRRETEPGHGFDNERLEFLGDSILGMVVSDILWRNNPAWEAGELSKSRSRLVSATSLKQAAERLDLGKHLRLGRGEEKTGGREKTNLLADAYEAVIAAIYIDGGFEATAGFIRRSLLEPAFTEHPDTWRVPDNKSALQEWFQQRGLGAVEYKLEREMGPDHHKTFWIEARSKGRRLASGEGRTKKEAEQAAARAALEQLERESAKE